MDKDRGSNKGSQHTKRSDKFDPSRDR